MRRAIATTAVAAIIASVSALPASAISRNDDLSLGEQITTDASYDWRGWDYDIIGHLVAKLVAEAGKGTISTDLGAALEPNAELTVFLPNDRAMKRLAYDLTGDWVGRESQVIPTLLATVGGDLQLINEVVEYHVIPGVVDSATATTLDGAEVTTVQGASLEIDLKSPKGFRIQLIDNDPDLHSPWLIRWDLDNFASNGVWHAISRVLLPLDV